MAGTFIYGDINAETDNPFFSTYFEFGYPFVLKNIEGEIHFGFSPFKGYYTEKAAIVSTGLTLNSRIGITEELHLPLKLSFHMNPYTSNAFIIFAFGIRKI
jgi:hypothetical protein